MRTGVRLDPEAGNLWPRRHWPCRAVLAQRLCLPGWLRLTAPGHDLAVVVSLQATAGPVSLFCFVEHSMPAQVTRVEGGNGLSSAQALPRFQTRFFLFETSALVGRLLSTTPEKPSVAADAIATGPLYAT